MPSVKRANLDSAEFAAVAVRYGRGARPISGHLDPVAVADAERARRRRMEPGGIGMHDLLQPFRLHRSMRIVNVPFETDHDELARLEAGGVVRDGIVDGQWLDALADGGSLLLDELAQHLQFARSCRESPPGR